MTYTRWQADWRNLPETTTAVNRGALNHFEDTFAAQDGRITALEAASGGGAVQQSVVDAKGDLIVASADNTITRLGVGANGQVLTADSTVLTTGVKWATPTTGGGGSAIALKDEGSTVNSAITSLNFVGTGVTAPSDGTITIPGGGSGGVPTSRLINTSTGLTGGGDLSADRTLSVVTDTTTQRVEVAKAGTVTANPRKRINFIEGSNVTITAADNAGANQTDVTINAATTGSSGIPASTVTAKGDLIAATGNATVARFGAGGDGQALVADSGNTNGLGLGYAPRAPGFLPCRLATTAAITRSGTGQTIDGAVVNTGDRVLDKDDTTAANRGIYIVSSGTWARAPDMPNGMVFPSGSLVEIVTGVVSSGIVYEIQLNGAATATVGTSALSVFPVTRKVLSSGTSTTLRAGLNFTGAGVTVTDDATNNKTDITIPGGSGTPPDATGTVKGVLKLTNDLGGTADLPTVPGLSGKVDIAQAFGGGTKGALPVGITGVQGYQSLLPAGVDGWLLATDSTQTAGLSWVAPGWVFAGFAKLSSAAATTGAISIAAYDQLMLVVRITGMASADVPALRFNGDSTTKYRYRFLTCAAGGATINNTEVTSTTNAGLSGNSDTHARVIAAHITNANSATKVGTCQSQFGTGTQTTSGALDVCGGFEWNNVLTPITSIELRTISGATMNTGSGMLIFGRNLA